MDCKSLKQHIASMRKSLFMEVIATRQSSIDEKILDEMQFNLLEGLANKGCRNFVKKAIDNYFKETTEMIEAIEDTLNHIAMGNNPPIDPQYLSMYFLEFKSKNYSIGAHKVTTDITKMMECYWQDDINGSRAAFEMLKEDHNDLKNKVEAYIELLRQASVADQSSSSNSADK